ncbi:MAG: membrane protein insertion efficiency factor YidD [Pauljensenia sp.]
MSARPGPVARLLVQPIRLYQGLVSPMTPQRCRYAPTCSAYAVEALQVHGALKGTVLATWRLLRCNPWSLGGVDHVPPRGRWRPDAWVPPADWAGNADIDVPIPMGLGGTDVPLATGRAGTLPTMDEGGAALVHTHLPAPAGRPVDALGVPTT